GALRGRWADGAARGRVEAGGARPGGARPVRPPRLGRARGRHGRPRGRALPAAQGSSVLTSIEIPYSVAAALPSLAVLDITNDVSGEVGAAGLDSGIAYITAGAGRSLVRVHERESAVFCHPEALRLRPPPL